MKTSQSKTIIPFFLSCCVLITSFVHAVKLEFINNSKKHIKVDYGQKKPTDVESSKPLVIDGNSNKPKKSVTAITLGTTKPKKILGFTSKKAQDKIKIDLRTIDYPGGQTLKEIEQKSSSKWTVTIHNKKKKPITVRVKTKKNNTEVYSTTILPEGSVNIAQNLLDGIIRNRKEENVDPNLSFRPVGMNIREIKLNEQGDLVLVMV